MALKDWIQNTSGEWYRKDIKYSYARVWKTALPLSEMKKRGFNGTYLFAARIGRDGIEIKKSFKTKSQALRFARAYMRKH